MTDQIDRSIRELMGAVRDGAPPPASWDEVLSTGAGRSVRQPARWAMMTAAAIVAVISVAVGINLIGGEGSVTTVEPTPVTDPSDTTVATVPTPTVTTTVPDPEVAPPPVALDPLCSLEPFELVSELLQRRVAGESPAVCLAPEVAAAAAADGPPCWPQCADGTRWTSFVVDMIEAGERTLEGASVWVYAVEMAGDTPDGPVIATEIWELHEQPALDAEPESRLVVSITAESSETGEPTAEQGVIEDYLQALADRRWTDAAVLLGEGGLSFEQRVDLAVLDLADGGADALADSLAAWCQVAECVAPSALDTVESFGGDPIVVATFPSGAVATFTAYEWEGAPAVTGLPPVVGRDALPIIAAAAGASTVVAQIDDTVVVWTDGEVVEIPLHPDTGSFTSVVSDDYLVFYHPVDGTLGVRAVTFDGTVVCEVEGGIHRITRRPDGTYVASVEPAEWGMTERDLDLMFELGEWPRPNDAVDCTTGERTPIDPITWIREGGARSTLRVADRQFDANYDAEGNGTIRSEDGIAIDGDDYAGWHTFSPDAARVVYGIYGGAMGPHYTTEIRSRDTITGAELWTAQLDTPFGRLIHTGPSVVVELPAPDALFSPWEAALALEILDAEAGTIQNRIPTSLRVIHLD